MTHWRPTSGPDAAKRRARMLRRLRDYFDRESVLEVDTPALSPTAVSDVHIESLTVSSCLTSTPLFLHTSPEFCMKRLLASGYPDIYSICRVFRDAEVGRRHQPEFTMVEWYRLGFGLGQIIADTIAAIATALEDSTLREDVVQADFRDVYVATCGVDPVEASEAALADAADSDEDLRRTIGGERDDWLDLLMTTRVAPSFAADKLTVVKHYPASQAALARLCPGDIRVADRFEVFMGTVELANGYVELTDAATQADRIENDQAARARRDSPIRQHDQYLLEALVSGLPACAGVAMGLERLQMMHDKTDDIRNVIPFPFETQHE
jgi:lysyl-tRNA synthetase class 2